MLDPLFKVRTKIIKGSQEVRRRLAEMGLGLDTLLRTADISQMAAANATSFKPASAAGLLSWIYGTEALRYFHVGENGWKFFASRNVEGIQNDTFGTRIIFQNGDRACRDHYEPQPISSKGPATEGLCASNQQYQYELPLSLPRFTSALPTGPATYYLILGRENGAVELSLPIVKNGQFGPYIERIYLRDENDWHSIKKPVFGDNDRLDDFDPQVFRKPRK